MGHSLFGLATDDDVSRLQYLTEKTAGRQKIIIHNTREMLTIINKTLEFQEEIKVNMKTMREREQVLKEQLEVHGNVLKKMNLKVVSLSLARAVDRTIDQLELVYAEYMKQLRRYEQQKMTLERGWLTEHVLSVDQLASILGILRTWGYETARPEWYFQYLHISPMWDEGDKLFYRVEIPAVDRTKYLFYKLNYFPVVLSDSLIGKVKGNNDIAINTESGRTFEPNYCYGKNPRICMPQKENLTPTCEYGLITNSSVNDCKIEISKRHNQTSDVYPLNDGHFVIVAYQNVEIITRCLGKPPIKETIFGSTIYFIPGDCKLETNEWSLSGIRKNSNEIRIQYKRIIFNRTLNFKLTPAMNLTAVEHLKFNKVLEIPLPDNDIDSIDNDLKSLLDDDNANLFIRGHLHYWGPVIIVAVILGVVVTVWIYRRRKAKVVKREQRNVKKELVELAALVS